MNLKKIWWDDFSTAQNIQHNIAKISAYVFMTMAQKKDYKVTVLWLKNLKKLNVLIGNYTLVSVSDITAIIPRDKKLFFSKNWTKW